MFDVKDVMLCKHSKTLAPFSWLFYHLEMIKLQEFERSMLLKALRIAGKQNLSKCHAFQESVNIFI